MRFLYIYVFWRRGFVLKSFRCSSRFREGGRGGVLGVFSIVLEFWSFVFRVGKKRAWFFRGSFLIKV